MKVETIAEQLLFTTVRIETVTAHGSSTGTGFIFSYRHGNQDYPFLVTNKHVVAGSLSGTITFHRGQGGVPIGGKAHQVHITGFSVAWHDHPSADVDVTVLPIAFILQQALQGSGELFFRTVNQALALTEVGAHELDAYEEVVFIGYPNGIWDTASFLPIMRRGTTATPVTLDFQGRRQFLIDAAVFPGSSGSPVFLFNKGSYSNRSGATVVGGNRVQFLGLLASVFYREDLNEIRMVPVPVANGPVAISRQMIGLGAVIKAATVIEAIESFLVTKGGLVLQPPKPSSEIPAASPPPQAPAT